MSNTIGHETLRAFRERLAREEKSPGTVEEYVRDAETFAAWLGERELTRETVAAWRDALLASGLGAGTMNGKLASVAALLRHLGREDCRVKALKLQRRAFRDPNRELTREEYARLVAAAEKLGRARAVEKQVMDMFDIRRCGVYQNKLEIGLATGGVTAKVKDSTGVGKTFEHLHISTFYLQNIFFLLY